MVGQLVELGVGERREDAVGALAVEQGRLPSSVQSHRAGELVASWCWCS